jgi:tetrahydromethanopterin S-methyltransferase subunit G
MMSFITQEMEIQELRARLEENDKKLEQLSEVINILGKFSEQMARDIRTVASHIALLEISQKNSRKTFTVKKSDDDLIN